MLFVVMYDMPTLNKKLLTHYIHLYELPLKNLNKAICALCSHVNIWLLIQAKLIEVERAQKWLKMIKAWDKYFPGEKVYHCDFIILLWGLWLSGRALASGAKGPEFEPPPGLRWCGRQALLTLAVYSVHSFNVFLVLKVGQMLYRACVHCS